MTLTTTRLQLQLHNRHYIHNAYRWFHIWRYIDDLLQLPLHPQHTLLIYFHDIYFSAISIEDTAHYNSSIVTHVIFLDMRSDYTHNNNLLPLP